ncbi:hypothetical protein [Paraburkholderia strydomiana]|uniref:hypothetical protein n=1 Tax=Paraburkholderia strydomiana TaxID=1245417 RepID=UPI00285D308A|nr:hypothetical protein [Paraburkholderia strydomiana]MDR7009655.1 hypothetical protein [Paraburkholderia strydomiana]
MSFVSPRREFLTRAAILSFAAAVPMSLSACGGSGSGSQSSADNKAPNAASRAATSSRPPSNLLLNTNIAGQSVTREQVLMWEARRLQVVAQRMHNNLLASRILDLGALIFRSPTSISNIDAEREQLTDAKIMAGDVAMMHLVEDDLLVSGPAMEMAALSGQWSVCQIEIVSSMGTAEGFADWFTSQATDVDNERAMLLACPDHYVIRAIGAKGQNVIEETGGALMASHFTIDYSLGGKLPYAVDPDFPVRLTGSAASTTSSELVGGVLHQFRTVDSGGFIARPAVFFPATLPFWFVAEHRWHLACEFSNWITAYVGQVNA